MRFRLIDAAKKGFPSNVSARFWASARAATLPGRDRPARRRQNEDMVLLAHIRLGLCTVERNLRQPTHDARASP